MADIDPNLAPSVMQAEQPIAKADGRPTTPMLNWLSAMRDWTKKSVVDLTTKITTLVADIDGLHGEIVNEATIRQTEDGILAEEITTVSTVANNAQATATSAIGLATSAQNTANNATANGEVYLKAMAGPAGSTAAFGIFLTAGNVFTGLMLVAYSGGVSKIVMTAGSLEFYDSSSGSQINMLTYSGGEWLLNGNVTLQASNGAGTMRWADGNLILRDAGGNEIVGMGLALP